MTKNPTKLSCPKCSCVVFDHDSASLVSTIDLLSSDSEISLPPLISSDNDDTIPLISEKFWLVHSQFDFYNIGVSVPVNEKDTVAVKTLKNTLPVSNDSDFRFLSCADCDVAPLGFYYKDKSSGKDIYAIDANRVVAV